MPRKAKRAAYGSKSAAQKVCISCGKGKPFSGFYKTINPLNKDGYITICKECFKKLSYDEEKDDINLEEFKKVLRQVDRPFIQQYWDSVVNSFNNKWEGKPIPKGQRSEIVGTYMKVLNSLHQLKSLTWNDGYKFDTHLDEKSSVDGESKIYLDTDNSENNYEITDDIIKLFGEGYSEKEYKAMNEKYQFLLQNYPGGTNLHIEALVTYVRFKVKAEMATARGNTSEAKSWDELAQKAADRAKINPSQLSAKDLQGGLNSFSEVFQALEQVQDVRQIVPEFKYRPNDAVDFTLWCYINYCRRLEGKPQCEYSDIYEFYDEKKKEYIEQYGDPYGIFKDDPTVDNREKVKKFIQLPSEFDDDETVDEEEDGETENREE